MTTFLKISYSILLLCTIVCFTSCDKDESQTTDTTCTDKAFYRGTHVCHNGENAAAIQIESNDEYLILENFFELIEEGSIEYDDVVYVEFEEVDFTDVSPALCGTAIVAPVTNLTCISVE